MRIVEGSLNAERFIGFLPALIAGAPRKIILVVDNLRVHHAKAVTEWLANKKKRIELAFLRPYNPQANPDEYLNHDFMTPLTPWPERVRAYFLHPKARYAWLFKGRVNKSWPPR